VSLGDFLVPNCQKFAIIRTSSEITTLEPMPNRKFARVLEFCTSARRFDESFSFFTYSKEFAKNRSIFRFYLDSVYILISTLIKFLKYSYCLMTLIRCMVAQNNVIILYCDNSKNNYGRRVSATFSFVRLLV